MSLNLEKSESTADGEKYGVDSSGESVYSSAKEFDEDCDTVFYTAIGCPSSSPIKQITHLRLLVILAFISAFHNL